MKKIFYLAFIGLIAVTACSKKDPQPSQSTDNVIINGTSYSTVVIGSQTWTSVNYNGDGGENYNNGANDPLIGKFYTIEEAKAITLPSGWHVPTLDDYNKLIIAVGGEKHSSGYYGVSESIALELMSKTGWNDTNGNNQIGFNALPAGFYKAPAAQFLYSGQEAFFIIDDPSQNNSTPLSFAISPGQSEINAFSEGSGNRWSVRFVKNN